jgi:hypothetical protein
MIFGGAGLVMLYLAVRIAGDEREKLRTWPLVSAHVDSATVVTPQRPREDVYASRYWLTYDRAGWPMSTVATRDVYTGSYPSVAREVERARARGTISAIVNPANPKDLQLDPGYNWRFFFGPIILGSLGAFFCGFAILFGVIARKQGLDSAGQAYTPGPAWLGAPFGAVMGVLFLGGAVIAVWADRVPRTTYVSTMAAVDSADVVQHTSDNSTTYATRYWVSYTVGGRDYRVPLRVPGTSSNYPKYAKLAGEARRIGRMRVLVDPHDPYDARDAAPGVPWGTILIAGIFAFFGVLSFVIGYVFWRSGHPRRRTSRKAKATPATGTA